MTDVAGLVIGVMAMWNTCVEVFDIVDSGKKYGMDYEILRVKLEVERIRLLTWGDAVGLCEVREGRPSPNARFNRNDIHGTVMRLLGCIQHVFENTERLHESYGLCPVIPSIPDRADDEGSPAQSQLILGAIFKRAYETLRKSAKERQRGTPLKTRTMWAIHDKRKFQNMISEIKGFNDNLVSLFPDIKRYTSENIRNEIDQSDDIIALQSLHEATTDDHEDISDTVSTRLEAIGATAAARSRISEGRHITGEIEDTSESSGVVAESDAPEELPELAKQMKAVDLYVSKKSEGALTLRLIGPFGHSARVSAHTYWDGRRSDDTWSSWDYREKGFVKSSHSSHGQPSNFACADVGTDRL